MELVFLRIVRNTPKKLVAVGTAPGFIEEVPVSILGHNSEQSNCCCIRVMIASGLRKRGGWYVSSVGQWRS
jgi:hypothetical protein